MKMKKIKITLSLVLILGSIGEVLAQKNYFDNQVIEIKGKALFNDAPASSYTVSVYSKGKKIDSVKSRSKRAIYFTLALNSVYSILYQAEGYDDKIIIVDTQIPKGLKYLEDFTHEFEVEMSNNFLSQSTEVEDMPVAILYIDKKEKMLILSEKYHTFIHGNNGYAYAPQGK